MGPDEDNGEVSRRNFTALSLAAGLAATAGAARAADLPVVETMVTIRTPDGVCDAAFIHPASGTHPGVLVWTDVFGLRPTFHDLGKRLAAQGYSVLVPNPFYRTAKAPVVTDASSFDFNAPDDRAKIAQWTGPINMPGAIEKDAAAYVGFLDAQRQVDTARKIGTQGYCMGGPLVFKTAASLPDRVAAAATFHGGGLVTDQPSSPHLLAPKIKAQMYMAVAASDDDKQPEAKSMLRQSFAEAHVAAILDVYPGTIHGWCIRDMPLQNGKPIYNQADADAAWDELLQLYRSKLA